MKGAAVEAHQALTQALIELAEHGGRPVCSTSADRWISDTAEDLEHARRGCQGCPIFAQCDAAGQFEVWGTYAGQWRGPLKNKERKSA